MNALDALGNPVRREILARLRAGPLSVGEIAASFDVSRPAISRHLRVLKSAGLVAQATPGTRGPYAIRRDGFEEARAFLAQFWDDALERYHALAVDEAERR
ncbi:MAG: ArsR/SmtB family transcription factor [Sandaracinaceae bacterium]